jgi:hypothetical protein
MKALITLLFLLSASKLSAQSLLWGAEGHVGIGLMENKDDFRNHRTPTISAEAALRIKTPYTGITFTPMLRIEYGARLQNTRVENATSTLTNVYFATLGMQAEYAITLNRRRRNQIGIGCGYNQRLKMREGSYYNVIPMNGFPKMFQYRAQLLPMHLKWITKQSKMTVEYRFQYSLEFSQDQQKKVSFHSNGILFSVGLGFIQEPKRFESHGTHRTLQSYDKLTITKRKK